MIDSRSWPLVTADEMRALDRGTIEDEGVPGEILMESAGRAVVEAVLARPEVAEGGEVLVVCGPGNNGGDGLVVARHLRRLGHRERVLLFGACERLAGDAAANADRYVRLGGSIHELTGDGLGELRLDGARVVVDALFGTGLTRALEGRAASLVEAMNAWRGPGRTIVAVDMPSGIHTETGAVLGTAVRADRTITISVPKLGLAQEPGRTHAGEVTVARIGIRDPDGERSVDTRLWRAGGAAAHFPDRPAHGHKGSFGHVLVIAGSEGKTGAAALCASAAGHAGAGLVTVACPAGLDDILEVKCTEAMTAPVAGTQTRSFAASSEDALLALAEARDVVALGPGIGAEAETGKLVRSLVAAIDRPLVIDADGLNLLAEDVSALSARRAPTVLTPHPGEAARLLASTAGELNADRVGSARRLAEATGSVVVLKGAASVVAEPGRRVLVNPTGNALLASGGSGDVLTGIVAGLLSQGLEAFEAAALAVYWHGAAADRLRDESGEVGSLAGDLVRALGRTRLSILAAAEAERSEGGGGLALRFP